MPLKKLVYVLLGVSVLGLAACTDTVSTRSNLANAEYWQRTDASSSIYLEGPKAQQMLQRDIAHCVTDVRELERLGAVRHATPGDTHPDGGVTDPTLPEGALELYQTPRRDHFLYSEYYNYHDFETCMKDKGWERTQYLPYDRAQQSRDEYLEAITGQHYRSTAGETTPNTDAPKPPQDENYQVDTNH